VVPARASSRSRLRHRRRADARGGPGALLSRPSSETGRGPAGFDGAPTPGRPGAAAADRNRSTGHKFVRGMPSRELRGNLPALVPADQEDSNMMRPSYQSFALLSLVTLGLTGLA